MKKFLLVVGIIITTILCVIGVSAVLFLCSTTVRAKVWEALHNPYCVLNHNLQAAIEEHDFDAAQKYVDKLAKYEEKRRNDEDSVYILRTAENYQSLLYELQGKYEEALKIQREWKGRIRLYSSIRSYEVFNVDYYAEARILYKLSRMDESFAAYCDATRYLLNERSRPGHNDDATESKDSKEKNFRNREIVYYITLNAFASREPAPFPEFPEFLKFAEEEYAKLGEPQEYAEAMEVFRSVNAELNVPAPQPDNTEPPENADLQ